MNQGDVKQSMDYDKFDDDQLLGLIAQRQVEALDQLYARHSRPIFSLTLMIVGDRSTAEEITLDVFMRVWQKAATYRPERASVSTWLTHIARHHAIDVLRRRSVRPDHAALVWDDVKSGWADSGADPEELTQQVQLRQRVRVALEKLPAEQERALMLAYFRGLSQSQIAEALRQPLGTIKTRIKLGMHKLRDLLREEQNSENASAQTADTYNIAKED